MSINIDISPNLLQEIRLIHSLCDEGVDIYCCYTDYLKLLPIKTHFNGNIYIGYNYEGENISNILKINHTLPLTEFRDKKKSLIFPRSLIKYCYDDLPKKRMEIFFSGKLTSKRTNSIKKLKEKLNLNLITEISHNGRNFPIKTFDKNYFDNMKKYKFIFCPDGDFIWTYRFFESVMCGAIPVIENDCELYKGFKYYKLSDDLNNIRYNEDWITHNIKILKEKFTL